MRRRSRSIFYLVGPIARARRKEDKKRAKKERKSTHGGESVGGVGDKHAGLADGAVPHGDALDEPRSAHRWSRCRSALLLFDSCPRGRPQATRLPGAGGGKPAGRSVLR